MWNYIRARTLAAAVAVAVAAPSSAHALCLDAPAGWGNHRVMAGTFPDVYFTAGVPETKFIRPIRMNFLRQTYFGQPTGMSDCQGYALSNIPGVQIQATYAQCQYYPSGVWTPIDVSATAENPLRFVRNYTCTSGAVGPGYEGDQGVSIRYDGTTPASSGTIDISVNIGAEITNFVVIGKINVHITAGPVAPVDYIETTTAARITGDSYRLDHWLINGKPAARIFIQHYGSGTSAATRWNHPIAVWYDTTAQRWNIRNEDATPMPDGLSFVIRIDPSALRVTTQSSAQGSYIFIDHPASNNNPYAVIVASPVSAGNRRMSHPFGVAYSIPDGKWKIQYTDAANMPTTYWAYRNGPKYEPGFNVKVLGAGHYVRDTLEPVGIVDSELSNGAGIDLEDSGVTWRTVANARYLRYWCWTQQLHVVPQPIPLIATYNMTPLPGYNVNAAFSARYYGVGLKDDAIVAMVYSEDGSTFGQNTPINVWAPHRASCAPN